MNGTLYGVGVGPGDPRLMTYLAVDTIKCCPVLAVPADGKGKAVAYRIASGIVKNIDQKECLDLTTPMTKPGCSGRCISDRSGPNHRKAGTGTGCSLSYPWRSNHLQHLYLHSPPGKSPRI